MTAKKCIKPQNERQIKKNPVLVNKPDYFLEYVFLLPEYLAFSFSERCLPIDRVHSSTPC